MSRRTNNVLCVCLVVAVLILAATSVNAQDTIEIVQTVSESDTAAPTAIVVQALEVERSPLEWVIVVQGAVVLFLFTLLMLNRPIRNHVLQDVPLSQKVDPYES